MFFTSLGVPAEVRLTGKPPVGRFKSSGDFQVTVSSDDSRDTNYAVKVVERSTLYVAMIALLGIAIAGPFAIASNEVRRPWYRLLSEPAGGLSLGRVQFLIWFLPAAVFWGAESLVAHGPAPMDMQLAVLLGLSGATTTLGAASNPKAADDSDDAAMHLSDLVQDWNCRGDLSRYQYLFLSLIGSLVLSVGFLQHLEFPAIPVPLLYLVAASQGTYIATKAIKTTRQGDDDAIGPSIVISMAPSTLRLGVGRCERVPAPKGHATPEGDMVVPETV